MERYEKIELERESSEFLYIQLYKVLKRMILTDVLTNDEKLPPIRKLADLLSVNNSTVVNAYKLLEEEELVYKKLGSGTFISKSVEAYEEAVFENYNFASGTLHHELFPIESFKNAMVSVLDSDGGAVFSYRDAMGYKPLREAIIKDLLPAAITCDVDDLMIVSGAQQGLDLTSKVLVDFKDAVIFEEPTYTGAISAFKMRNASVYSFDITDTDNRLAVFTALVEKVKPKIFYTMGNFNNPTGLSYTEEEKKAILELAEEYDFYIVEDDYSSEFDYINNHKSFKCYDRLNRVLYVKSFSKILMPGMRLGYMIVPKTLKDKISFAKLSSDIASSGLLQRALYSMIISGDFKSQQAETFDKLKVRYMQMVKMLSTVDGLKLIEPGGGIYLWLELMKGSAQDFYQYAKERDILIVPGDAFYINKKSVGGFRVCIAALEEEHFDEGLVRLKKALTDYLSDKSLDDAFKQIL